MNESRYIRRKKAEILKRTNKGLDVYKKICTSIGVSEEQMYEGFFFPPMNRNIKVYFDEEKDQWMHKVISSPLS